MTAARYVVLCGWLFVGLVVTVRGEELPRAKPVEEGFAADKLDRVKSVVQKMIEKHQTAGVVLVVARHGKVVRFDTYGQMDVQSGKPMKPDTLFRIYSMTKPITTVAAMMLWEEGRFQLDDPVARYLPEFKGLRVYAGEGKEPVEPKRPVSIRDLMRHTSGLTYGIFGNSAVDKLYRDAKVLPPKDTADLVRKLAKLPLMFQPGTRFNYGLSTDVLGRLVEVISGKTLDAFFQERIVAPLDMKDTGFFVPPDQLARLATVYRQTDMGTLTPGDTLATSRFTSRPKFLSGGGGLVSTATDYLRFCQMVLNGGQLEGKRLLRPETVRQMTTNQLPAEAVPIHLSGVSLPEVGFGLGFSVGLGKGKSQGEYGWGGAACTHFWISPKEDLIVIAMQQLQPFSLRLEQALKPVIYEAITD